MDTGKKQSGSQQQTHVEKLWQVLDSGKNGRLDINGLKQGLKKLDHRTKTAQQAERTG